MRIVTEPNLMYRTNPERDLVVAVLGMVALKVAVFITCRMVANHFRKAGS